jgi:hypothetical protein
MRYVDVRLRLSIMMQEMNNCNSALYLNKNLDAKKRLFKFFKEVLLYIFQGVVVMNDEVYKIYYLEFERIV